MSFQIEKNIPIPEPKTQKSIYREALDKLSPGDSFFVNSSDRAELNKAKAIAMNLKHRSNKVFITRRYAGGLRIWRTK